MMKRKQFSQGLIGLSVIMLAACHSSPRTPERGSAAYDNAVSTFYVGLSALQVGDDVRAEEKLAEFAKLVPGEPAGWANWAVLALRQRNYDAAAQRLDRARDLAPHNAHIEYLRGLLESDRGNSVQAIADLRKAFDENPQNLRAAYQLAEEIERQGDANSDAEFQQVIQSILAARPDSLAALVELSRIASKRGDRATLDSVLTQIRKRSASWPPEVQQQLAKLQADVSSSDLHAAATQTVFLRNVLMRVPEYRQSLSEVKAPPGDEAQPFTHFVRMESPIFATAPEDKSLSFTNEPISGLEGGHWDWIGAISLGISGAPVVVEANGTNVHLASGATFPFPGGASHSAPLPEGILPIDFNYDFKADLVLSGEGGFRLLRQDSPNAFTDVTAATKLPKHVLSGKYIGAWAIDIEADGDLDIVLGTASGIPSVLRNNGDGTFVVLHPFAGISGLRGLAWGDFDGDGNPDVALIDGANHLHVFMNERSGQFRERSLPSNLPAVKALAVGDANNDGIMDLLAVGSEGSIFRLSDKNEGQAWDLATVANVPNPQSQLAGEVRLRVADLDNNGSMDLLLAYCTKSASSDSSGALIWLGDGHGQFVAISPQTPNRVFDAADTNTTGRLDLLGLTADGQPVRGVNHGSKDYHWLVVRPHARQATGDQRINPFGIGGEIEVRAGLLVQKQRITGPQLHFGLGEQTQADVVRVIWPNGAVRAEFAMAADHEVVTEQRLKGSCPYLFAYNGHSVEFVKDAVPWSSAIGLRINTLGTARVEATEEWYKIRGDQLIPHNGIYDLRFTAEYWETYYYDYLSLWVVDHPAGTEIFDDERFVIPPAKLAVTATGPLHKIVRAVDDNGSDVTDIVKDLDERYLDTFGRGQYQGVTRDHYVEVDLGDDVPQSGPLYLIAQGWMHPTDSSVNVAMGQGNHPAARGLSLEVPDGRGGWVVVQDNLGFPAGRKKIVLFDLTHVFRPNTPRNVRLRTNLEIFWDSIEWTVGLPDTQLRISRLAPVTADLHYRGYSQIQQPNRSSPEIPDYNHLEGSKQRWRDLTGYYTRYGDVRELLSRVDDRYVIMNSGDEMSLSFAEQAPPSQGWVRDYIIVGDGWIKDGDYNSTFGKTVLPLPYHAKNLYVTPPTTLEDEWVYKHHPEDWQNYQTRYVWDDSFKNALRNTE